MPIRSHYATIRVANGMNLLTDVGVERAMVAESSSGRVSGPSRRW